MKGTYPENVDVAFDGAFVRREDVDSESRVEVRDGPSGDCCVGDWGGG